MVVMRQVHAARNLTEAHLLRGVLDAEGIAAVVRGEHVSSLRGEVPMTPDTLPSVWVVRDDDFEHARQVVEGYLRGEVPAGLRGEPWLCPGCGEELEGQFTECWQCGTGRSMESTEPHPH